MNDKLAELVFVLDASGSMDPLRDDTIGGFNSMIRDQKNNGKDVLVSAVSFNNDSTVVYDRVDINEIPAMTEKDYVPTGCTALMDAMGDAIHHIGNVHKYIREEDRPSKTIFVIITDGMENASHKYSSDEIKRLVSEKTEGGWEFIFLAANIDAVETAARYGIRKERAANFVHDDVGVEKSYSAVSKFARKAMAMKVNECAAVLDDWADELTADTVKRDK